MKLLNGGKTLSIKLLTLKDDGNYTCRAKNVAGTTRKNFRIEIHDPPKIDPTKASDKNLTAIVTESTFINCPAIGTPKPRITWYKDGRPIDLSKLNLRVLADGKRLEFSATEVVDTGEYMCVAENVAGKTNRTVTLEIHVRPSINDADEIDRPEVVINRTAEIICPAFGIPVPRITWYRDGIDINTLNDQRVTVVDSGRLLRIRKARVSDAVRYRCRAVNVVGESDRYWELQVLVPAKIQRDDIDTSLRVVVEQTSLLNCIARGNPTPQIKWYKNGELFDASLHPNAEILGEGYQLRIEKSQVSDTAKYECRTKNKAGADNLEYDLFILVPTKIASNGLDRNPRIIVNKTATLSCPVTGIPTPKITWFKSDRAIDVSKHKRLKLINNGLKLEVTQSEVDDTGSYTCYATNEAGEDSIIYDLAIWVPPSIDIEETNTNPSVIVNKTIQIECKAVGVPPPKITWLRAGHPFSTKHNKHFRVLEEGRTLELRKARIVDTSIYTCVATNDAGSAEQRFNLSVWVPPFINNRNLQKKFRIIQDETVVIHCPASGVPFPSITWLKNGSVLKPSSRVQILAKRTRLEIAFVQVTDTADYTCIADNVAGIASEQFNLFVLVKPAIDDSNRVNNPKVVINRTVIIECPTVGVPQPKMTWFKNGELLSTNDHIRLLGKGQKVEIKRAIVSDVGRYICIAKNEAGEDRRYADLEVFVPPTIDDTKLKTKFHVIQNRTAFLDCPAVGNPNPSFIWYQGSRPLLDWPYKNLRLHNSDRQLEISNAQTSDAQIYTCKASNIAGQIKRKFKLAVWVPPRMTTDLPHQLTVTVRRPISITCPASGTPDPTIKWYKDGKILDLKDNLNIGTQDNGKILQIYSSKVEHAGQYVCRAKNPAGLIEKYYNLKVFVPPTINGSDTVNELSVVLNNPITMECLASGIPTPTITWVREGEIVTAFSHPSIQILDRGRRLRIYNALLRNIGNYHCTASNPAGNSTKEFLLNVLVLPSIEDGPTTVSEYINSRTLLQCETRGLPDPKVTWFKDGKLISNNGLTYRMHRSGTLEFSTLQLSNSGLYKCVATNEAGTASRNIQLNVQVRPKIEPTSKHVKIVEDSPIYLPCEATGIPKPVISWQKGATLLSSALGYRKVYANGTLKIEHVRVSDSGIYICIAQNTAGTDVAQIKLEVQVAPIIDRQQTKYTAVENLDVLLPCRARGKPSPRIRWMKDGKKIAPTDFSYRVLRSGWLSIPVASFKDKGIFTCVAENDAGNATLDLQLTVQVPPKIEQTKREVTVVQGDAVFLRCKTSGFPPPKVTWMKEYRTILGDDHFILRPDGSLHIKKSRPNDQGNYLCAASNIAGRSSKNTVLKVNVPPSFTLFPKHLEVNVGQQFELECEATGRPVPRITWLKNNNNNTSNTVLPAETSINGRSRLYITNALKDHQGTYICLAKNDAGERPAIGVVRVHRAPTVLPIGNSAVRLSNKVILDCPVVGDPKPEIIWTKNGREVELNNRVNKLANGSLVIYTSKATDGGKYQCTAVNTAGTSSRTQQLQILSVPEIAEHLKPMFVEQFGTIIMHCVAIGEPKPTVTWKKDGRVIDNTDRITIFANDSLRIVAVQVEDDGIYSCLVKNSNGAEFTDAKLTVLVHGAWSDWSNWNLCSKTCGKGIHFRERQCDSPRPLNGGRSCFGNKKEVEPCSLADCEVHGHWSPWTAFSQCSKTCGSGKRSRNRECNQPKPQFGGKFCAGANTENIDCNVLPCPIDGQWSTWGPWQRCSETCGHGSQLRYRRCDSPVPEHGGQPCASNEREVRPCEVRDCSVHGNWGLWTHWSSCTVSCDGGTKTRARNCNNPPPLDGGRFCAGDDVEVDYCNSDPCPVHGKWSTWSAWGDCSVSCNGGIRRRFRSCTDPPHSNGGRPCMGSSQETGPCNKQACPSDGVWSSWGVWTKCTRSCGAGTMERKRVCRTPRFGGRLCLGDPNQVKKCNISPCRASFPVSAIGDITGQINDIKFGISTLEANVTQERSGTVITAKIKNVPSSVGVLMRHLVSVLTAVYWTTALEVGSAVNGYTLTKANFRREVWVQFSTGQILKMTHVAKGMTDDGVLNLDIVVTGYVPKINPGAIITINPYHEDYIQTAPGEIYAFSRRTIRINGHLLPYAWNHTITYSPELGSMPYLVERLYADDLTFEFNPSTEIMKYELSTTITKGEPSNQCPTGFSLEPEGPYCHDDDECVMLDPCSHYCHNNPGSFSCSCPIGMSLSSDGRTCKDINECERRISNCHSNQVCINTIGSYRCSIKCGTGFRRASRGFACQDINECREGKPCDQQCFNLIGSFQCQCSRGYKLLGKVKCVDINECKESSSLCSHTCTNTAGSYRCSCPAGFNLLSNRICRDINECTDNTHTCNRDEKCVNKQGGYECQRTCSAGFQKARNGTCIDLDECMTGHTKCHFNQICYNTVGSYQCRCPKGYESKGPGQPCTDYNECQQPRRCQHQCVNTAGSYRCLCPHGYRLTNNRRTCKDINECKELAINCGQDKMCFNRRGDYRCISAECPTNYVRHPQTGDCILYCSKTTGPCPSNNRYADILSFKTVALPSGIPAFRNLLRLIAYNYDGVLLPQTKFEIVQNDPIVPFALNNHNGKGIVFALKPLRESSSYQIKVKARSYDHTIAKRYLMYQTTFIIHISVAAYPY